MYGRGLGLPVAVAAAAAANSKMRRIITFTHLLVTRRATAVALCLVMLGDPNNSENVSQLAANTATDTPIPRYPMTYG